MGCSPSHNGIIQILASNVAKPLKRNKAILPPDYDTAIPLSGNKTSYGANEENQQKCILQEGDHQTDSVAKGLSDVHGGLARNGSLKEQGKNERHGTADEGMVNLTYQKRRKVRKHSSTGSEQELSSSVQQEGNPRKIRKSKRSLRHGRRSKQNPTEAEKKVEFPEGLVKAHQEAYAFLNPNLSKLEAVISMANQATQTQLIMQQMTSFMALRFDEINHCLGEIAEDGEKLLKDVGSNLTWPIKKGELTEHPDLLQQLLQYTINRMQSVNCTVASLTTTALQETCSFLQSAIDNFQEKLKQKECHDQNLQQMIKSLEESATGTPQPQPNDLTLYSEDSGIGGDSESIKGYRSTSTIGRQSSIESSGQASLWRSDGITDLQEPFHDNKVADVAGDSKSLSSEKELIDHSSQVQLNNQRVTKKLSSASSLSTSSLGTTTTLEQDSHDQESEDSTSSEESSEDSDDNKSLASQITLPPRPLTSPAGTGGYKLSPKWLENPENEEMTLKMKEAISERIKFVPGKSVSDVWTREEEVSPKMVRPSTADGSNRRTSKQRRSRSAESLRSQAEDPTLLELQRTQKELSKKLEQLYSSSGTKNKETAQNTDGKSFLHSSFISLTNSTSTNKLKACLDKNFNILPSQERVNLKRFDKPPLKDLIRKAKGKPLGPALCSEDNKTENYPTLVQQKFETVQVSPRQSVRKLIQTFSPTEDLPKSTNGIILGPLRCIRKFGIPVLPPTIPASNPLIGNSHILSMMDGSTNTYLHTSKSIFPIPPSEAIIPDSSDPQTEDFDDLPPPPPEILMDDSFNMLQAQDNEKEASAVKKTSASQKIKSSINIQNLLPSKKATGIYISTDKTFKKTDPDIEYRKYSLDPVQQRVDKELDLEIQKKHEIELADHLYKQSCKIIPLQNPCDGEEVQLGTDVNTTESCTSASSLKLKQSFSASQRSEKSPVTIRRNSPTRGKLLSPPTERRLPSLPGDRSIKTHSPVQPNLSLMHKSTSSTSTPSAPSPPNQKKLPSPPTQQKLPSPLQTRRQQSPPTQRGRSSPPQVRRQQSPPVQHMLSSPPQIRKQQNTSAQGGLPSPPQTRRQQSPPVQHALPSPPQTRGQESQQPQSGQPSPPQTRKQQSPPAQRKLPSPPQTRGQHSPQHQGDLQSPTQTRRQQSPPAQRRLPSPPQAQRQQSPPIQRRLPSPPNNRREPSPPSHVTASPPVSPSLTKKGLRRSSDEPQPSSNIIGNAQSIFCPSSTSLFEAKPVSPLSGTSPETTNQVQSPVLRHNLSCRRYEDRRRSVALSAANPQPFVRRCYSDRRPRVQLLFPTSASTTAISDSVIQVQAEEPTQKDGDTGSPHCLADPRASDQTAAHSELCVVGQRFNKD